MSMISINRIIPVVGIVIVAAAATISLRACKSQAANQPAMMSTLPQAPSPEADTPADTVRTLSAQVSDLLDSTKTLSQENRQLRQQNQDLFNRAREDDNRVRSHVRQELNKQQNLDNGMISSITQRLDQLGAQVSQQKAVLAQPRPVSKNGDIPVGFGLDGGGSTIHWVEPLTAPELAGTAALATRAGGAASGAPLLSPAGSTANAKPAVGKESKAAAVTPMYTIPANATLTQSTAFSAMIGRVPVGGQVQDPMPFKVLIGAPNLAANGHEIPGIEGMVMSGYAVGDWTLSCVRGYVTSATFVFHDGRIVTVGDKKKKGAKQNTGDQETIGWVSDQFGVPCISGKRITNAPSFLSQRVGLTALQAAAEAFAANQTTANVSADTGLVTSTVTGDPGRYALGKAVSGGATEVNKWLSERMSQSFDAIFVAAGTTVAVNLDVSLPIDHDPNGRRLDHRRDNLSGKQGVTLYGHLD